MKYFRQFFLILAISFAGEILHMGAAITSACKHLRTGVNAACAGNRYR